MTLHIGTAGWTLPSQHAHHFPSAGTHLQRYAPILSCAEINSSFHRPHLRKTWERWAASTPDHFRFSVKVPKTITHTAKLANCGALLQTFLDQASGLNAGSVPKLGPLLIQLPPSLAFDPGLAHEFFSTFRELHTSPLVLEPRHATWFAPAADRLLRDFQISRAAADPAKASPLAVRPGGSPALRYYRLHGSPRTYYSEYTDASLQQLAATLRSHPATAETWVIFDNTAAGHATANALTLRQHFAPPHTLIHPPTSLGSLSIQSQSVPPKAAGDLSRTAARESQSE
jgi:uncharacterized protein YecE (DUF72 family)